MLETKFKLAFLVAVLFFTSLPLVGILRGTSPTPKEDRAISSESDQDSARTSDEDHYDDAEEPIAEEMVLIPAGPFTRGTMAGGYDEQPEGMVSLSAFHIDRYEVTNFQYNQFREATGHRKPSPPSRTARTGFMI